MVLALSAADVGSRVVVRRRVSGADRPLYTDLLGELLALSDTEVVILTSRGTVRVPLDEIHRAKPIPARRGPTARDVAALERAATRAWPPAELAWLGDWRLRAAEGYTGRANSALPIGNPGVRLDAAFAQVVTFYRDRGLLPQIDVPIPLASGVQRELIKAGWREECTVLVQTITIDDLVAATPPGPAQLTLSATLSPAATQLIAGRRGPLPEAAGHVLTAVPRLLFSEYAEGSDLLAMARGSITSAGVEETDPAPLWLGLFAIETVPAARRRGLAQQVIGALARWGRDEGAVGAFLQVESGNAAAIRLYEKLGFTTHHRYIRYAQPLP